MNPFCNENEDLSISGADVETIQESIFDSLPATDRDISAILRTLAAMVEMASWIGDALSAHRLLFPEGTACFCRDTVIFKMPA